jgi:hypothetical protein
MTQQLGLWRFSIGDRISPDFSTFYCLSIEQLSAKTTIYYLYDTFKAETKEPHGLFYHKFSVGDFIFIFPSKERAEEFQQWSSTGSPSQFGLSCLQTPVKPQPWYFVVHDICRAHVKTQQ